MKRVFTRTQENFHRPFGIGYREMEYMNIREAQTAVQQELARHHDAMIQFLRDLVAIPSFDSQIGPVGDAVGALMSDLGFDEVRRDSMGNILGRVRDGPRIFLYDSQTDTVVGAGP